MNPSCGLLETAPLEARSSRPVALDKRQQAIGNETRLNYSSTFYIICSQLAALEKQLAMKPG